MIEQKYYLEILKKMKKEYTKRIKDCIGVLSYNSIVEYENKCNALSLAIEAVEQQDKRCKICKYIHNINSRVFEYYCPNCGAHMEVREPEVFNNDK